MTTLRPIRARTARERGIDHVISEAKVLSIFIETMQQDHDALIGQPVA
jgi:hypothetical protein